LFFLIRYCAAGLLRLLVANRTYNTCKGGATLLATYSAFNETSFAGRVYHEADFVRNWQVCTRYTKENCFH